jgi:glycosyltransferase involved in cell wall biosynthesis
VDGVFWGRSPQRTSPYVLALKGIAADEARFSRSISERLLLSTLARWEKSNAEGADLVLVPSAYSAEIARTEYGCRDGRLRVVPEPIDLSLWEPHHPPLPLPSRPTILSVARQYPRKDTGTLLRAALRVRREIPELHLRIVGGGPDLETLRGLSHKLGLDRSVTFHGAVQDDREVRAAYQEAHLFALPSLQEGFGIVFLEAMASGLPVVATRAGAAPEVIGWSASASTTSSSN